MGRAGWLVLTIMEKQQQMFADDPVVRKVYKIPRYRVLMVKEGAVSAERKRMCSPQDIYNAVGDIIENVDREYFLIVILDAKNHINGVNVVSIGTINSTQVHPREVFKAAILANAAAIICVHNHPSGDPVPSKEDIDITHRLAEAGKVVGIEVLDHVVIGDGCWVSLKEKGIL
jgi:DNA repair protein RadC